MKSTESTTLLKDLITTNREQRRHADEQVSFWIRERKRLDSEFTHLSQVNRITGGEPFEEAAKPEPLAFQVADILRNHGKLHVDAITSILALPPYNRGVEKQTIVGTLVRYISNNKRFVRVGKNTFALRDNEKGTNL